MFLSSMMASTPTQRVLGNSPVAQLQDRHEVDTTSDAFCRQTVAGKHLAADPPLLFLEEHVAGSQGNQAPRPQLFLEESVAGGQGNQSLAVKGQISTINVDNTGPLLRYMNDCKSAVVMVQEHKADEHSLPTLEYKLKQAGYHGMFAPAVRTDKHGLSAGVAVLVPNYVTVTPPWFEIWGHGGRKNGRCQHCLGRTQRNRRHLGVLSRLLRPR